MDEALKVLLSQGLPGVIIVILLLTVRVLFAKYEDAQAKRIEDGLANQERMHEAIMALDRARGQLK
jgi:hypothetical protein